METAVPQVVTCNESNHNDDIYHSFFNLNSLGENVLNIISNLCSRPCARNSLETLCIRVNYLINYLIKGNSINVRFCGRKMVRLLIELYNMVILM